MKHLFFVFLGAACFFSLPAQGWESGGESAKAPAGESARPPAGESARPPAGESARPPAGESARPPAGESVRPQAGESARPPAGESALGGAGKSPQKAAAEKPKHRASFISIRSDVSYLPAKSWRMHGFPAISLNYGGSVTPKSLISVGLQSANNFGIIRYEYNFFQRGIWVPGAEASFAVGASSPSDDISKNERRALSARANPAINKKPPAAEQSGSRDYSSYLSFGAGAGFFLKGEFTDTVSASFRLGAKSGNLRVKNPAKFKDAFQVYLGVEARWYFEKLL